MQAFSARTVRAFKNCNNYRHKLKSDLRGNFSDNTMLRVHMHLSIVPRCSGPFSAGKFQRACRSVLSFQGRYETAHQVHSHTASQSEAHDQNWNIEKIHFQPSPGLPGFILDPYH